jgi:hypothetical protein
MQIRRLMQTSTRLAFVLGLPQHRLGTLLEVIDDVLSNEPKALSCADHSFELRPHGLELFFPFDFFALGRFFKVRVHLWALRFVEFELGQTALVVNWYGRFVFNGTLEA